MNSQPMKVNQLVQMQVGDKLLLWNGISYDCVPVFVSFMLLIVGCLCWCFGWLLCWCFDWLLCWCFCWFWWLCIVCLIVLCCGLVGFGVGGFGARFWVFVVGGLVG